jgi:hypothetical protein
LLPLIHRSLTENNGCMQQILARVRLAEVALPPGLPDALRDIDTLQDAADFFTRQLPAPSFLVR